MPLVALAAYTTPAGAARRVAVLLFGPPLAVARPVPALLAARLAAHPALVLDRAAGGTGETRVVGELEAGEGLAALKALVDDYLPRARRATGTIARRLEPDDLLGPPSDRDREPGAAGGEEASWAA